MDMLLYFAPIFRIILPPLKLQFRKKQNIFEKSAFLCTSCGNCLSVCQAYATTNRESASPRGKLNLARIILSGKKIPRILAEDAFLCTWCRNCERICQSSISHFQVWDDLENRLEKITGIPEHKIKEFIDSLTEVEKYLNILGCDKWENL
jgi:glycolate oxidase iron-sulfur subunit